MCPPLGVCVDARAVDDAISASVVCEPAGSSLKFHLISVRDRMTYGHITKLFWADARDMLADGQIKGGIDRLLLRSDSNDCKYQATREALMHTNHSSAGSATMPRLEDEDPPSKEEQ